MGAGPRIHRDGLALGFDTGRTTVDDNTFNYSNFLGEPTVNYTTDTPSQGGWTGTQSVLDSSRKKFRFNVSNFSANPGQGWRSFTWDLRAYTGQSVTISATVEVPDLSPGTFAWVMMGQGNTGTNTSGAGGYMGYSAASERVQKTTTAKEHITWSGTLGNSGTASQPSGHVGFTVWYNNGVPGVNSFIEVSDVQIELKSHETPFVNGTRGNTNNLKDLSNNCVIDITNTSYGTASNMELDGTDDIISVTGFTQPSDPNVFTAEAIVKVHSHNSNTNIGQVIINNYSSYNGWIFFLNGTTSKLGIRHHLGTNQSMPYNLVYGTGLSLNEWYHVAATDDGITVRLYLNGTQVASQASGTATNFSGQPKIGGWSAGSGLDIDGEQPVTRVYNKTLTASEINSNYEAYKNRFNLS
tara:strand:+ start:802 stop:2034 length:1233 start_codon:yes stop_codon:yes gene_type:complete